MNTNPYSTPRNWLVFEAKLDWNANDNINANIAYPMNMTRPSDSSIGYQKWYWLFNWSNSYIEYVNTGIPTWNSQRTISCWIYINSFASNMNMFFWIWKSDAWSLQCFNLATPNNYPKYLTWNFRWSDLSSSYILQTWKWIFLTMSYDWTTARLYADNVMVSSWNFNLDTQAGDPFIWVLFSYSAMIAYSNTMFDWKLCLARIYNRVLLDTEIRTLYMEGKRILWLPSSDPTTYAFAKSLPLWLQRWLKLWIDWSNNGSWIFYDVMRNHNGTGVNNPTISNILQHKAIDCTWNNKLIFSSDIWLPNWNSDRTLSIQIKLNSSHLNVMIWYWTLSNWNAFFIHYNPSWIYWDWVRLIGWNADINTWYILNVWKWYHITFTYWWTTLKVYINWILIYTWTVTLNTILNEMAIWWLHDPNNFSDAYYANWMIWNRILSSEEIYQLYISNYIQ